MIDWTSVLEFVKQDFRWLANILGLYLQSSSCQQVMVGGKWQYLAVIMFHLSLMPPWWWQNCGPYRTPIGNEIYFVHFARKSRERWEMCIREHRCLIAPWISTYFITKHCSLLLMALWRKPPTFPRIRCARMLWMVTGQLADTPTRGLPTRGLDDSRTGHLAD